MAVDQLTIRDLKPGVKNVNMTFIILDIGRVNTTKEGHEVRTCKIADRTGSINLSLWDEPGNYLQTGDICRLTKGYASIWKTCLTLYCGKGGEIMKVGEFCLTFTEIPNLSEPNIEFVNSKSKGDQRSSQSSLPQTNNPTTTPATTTSSGLCSDHGFEPHDCSACVCNRRISVFINALVEMPGRETNIFCATQITRNGSQNYNPRNNRPGNNGRGNIANHSNGMLLDSLSVVIAAKIYGSFMLEEKNLKKSWHPSTLKNIERVWKAEQKHSAEQKKIEQLQKELHDERGREEMQQFAENKGVIEKKEGRLDWMYAGPAAMVERDEYLLGRQVDKTFEVMDLHAQGLMDKSVDDGNQPGAIFSGTNKNISVDLASKVQQDPLFAIKKKEQQAKKDILLNPVKMKQLQQYLEKTVKKSKKKKSKKKKSKKSRYSSDDSDSDEKSSKINHHDKYNDFHNSKKNKVKDKHRRSDRYKSSKHSDDSDIESYEKSSKINHHDKNKDFYNSKRNKIKDNSVHSDRSKSSKLARSKATLHESSEKPYHRKSVEERNSHRVNKRRESSNDTDSEETVLKNNRHLHDSSSDDDIKPRKYGLIGGKRKRANSPSGRVDYRKFKVEKPKVYKPEPRKKLSTEEIDKRRKEMMSNAKWRDDQRSKNVQKYREEAAKERENQMNSKGEKFIAPMLSKIAESGSIEARIKSNKYNIQRSGTDLNKNFAKRTSV
ncbi:SOSS complex subunit B1 [Nymphon striatum]|nr:SOSS complex subunit B1 [Nymphon striatum]